MTAKPGLGAVQRQALIRLYGSPDGLTAPQLADLSAGFDAGDRRSIALTTLKRLRGRGLAVTAGQVPRQGRGGRAFIWVLTDEGREMAKEQKP
jgi:hypothetical protein